MTDINLDKVVVEDANEMAHALVAAIPKEVFPANFDGVTCVDCGDPIEESRLKFVRTCRCGECQGWHLRDLDKKAKQGDPTRTDDY